MEGTLLIRYWYMDGPWYTYFFFNLGLVWAKPGGEKAATGLEKIGLGLGGTIDTIGNVVTLGHLNDSNVGLLIDGFGDIVEGATGSGAKIVNETLKVSKSQKNFFLYSNTIKSWVLTHLD